VSRPECPYCGATEDLRLKCDGGFSTFGFCIAEPEYTCEACFTPRDDGPCFDDLAVVMSADAQDGTSMRTTPCTTSRHIWSGLSGSI
jgi:hypothetical protein